MKVVRRHTRFEESASALLREFVEKIVIHEPEAPDGKRRGVVELKWDQSAAGAICQIIDKRYPECSMIIKEI